MNTSGNDVTEGRTMVGHQVESSPCVCIRQPDGKVRRSMKCLHEAVALRLSLDGHLICIDSEVGLGLFHARDLKEVGG